MNEAELLLYDAHHVRSFVNSPSRYELPAAKVLARFQMRHPSALWLGEPIDRVNWSPDSQSLFFIGRGKDSIGNVYKVDVSSGSLKQLSHSDTDVARYSAVPDGSRLIYFAYEKPDWTERNEKGFTVTSGTLADVLAADAPVNSPTGNYFLEDLDGKRKLLNLPQPRDVTATPVLSPGGRYAVVPAAIKSMPEHWRNYEFVQRTFSDIFSAEGILGTDGTVTYRERPEFGDYLSSGLRQLHLIDLGTGRSGPLFDAPIPEVEFFPIFSWSPDERSVIVGRVLIPVEHCTKNEAVRCRRSPAIAEVDIESRRVRRIADTQSWPALTRMTTTPPQTMRRTAKNRLEIEFKSYQENGPFVTIIGTFQKRGDRWVREREVATESPPARGGLRFAVEQGLDTPPELSATDTSTQQTRVITDLNPQLRGVELGRSEAVSWTDKYGRSFQGALLSPPGWKEGKPLPLVIQTSGFSRQFLMNGADINLTSAFAARPLAAAGMMVLQLSCDAYPSDGGTAEFRALGEQDRVMVCIEAATESLAKRGIIDPERVGLIGFSRTGMYTMHIVTFSRLRFAAATIADSVAASPSGYGGWYAGGRLGMLDFEGTETHGGLIGAPLWGDGVARWVEKSPLFHLDRVRTPLRYETNGEGVPQYWDVYAILKRMRRPIEMLRFPRDTHQLRGPWARYRSQQGNVDWYAFWLLDKEREDVEDPEQYVRWRELRKLSLNAESQ